MRTRSLLAVAGTTVASVGGACGMAGMVGGAVVAMVGAPRCALAQCGDIELTQSTDPDVIQAARAVWCGTAEFNDDTRIGRGFTASEGVTISCVTFGVTRNTGADWPCHVRILGGSITEPYASRPVLGEAIVTIPAGTVSEFFTATLPAVFVPAGGEFIVELFTPSRNPAAGGDGALLSLGFNNLGQSAPTYLRAEGCGLSEYADLAGLGFPNSHAAISVGVDAGYAVGVLGGFPISPIGPALLSTAGGEVTAYSDGSGVPVGLSVDFGDLTMGAGVTFSAISTGDEPAPTVEMAFHGATTTDRLVFRNNPATADEAVLDVVSDNPDFDRFNVLVFREGVLVGTFEDQVSGAVRLTDPDDGPLWDWVKGAFGGPKVKGSCTIEKTESPDGTKTSKQTYEVEVKLAAFAAPGGGGELVGDEIWIEPATASVSGEPPVEVSVITTGLVGVAVDVSSSAPTVVIGDADSAPRAVGDDFVTQVGVSFRAIKERGIQFMEATDFTGDGLADLRIVPVVSTGAPGDGDGVRMELGGVVSASVGMSVGDPGVLGACASISSFGPLGIPTGGTRFDPWPPFPGLIAVLPDFTGVGPGQYTLQVYDEVGTLVLEEGGLEGIGGGTTEWSIRLGKLGGPTPCFVFEYPFGTTFRFRDGRVVPSREIRVLAEGAGPAEPLSALHVVATSMGELRLFDPVTELPNFGTPPCRADLDGDGALTIFDFLAFQNLFDSGDPLADFDGDGALTIFDFLAFQNEFDAGCP